MLKISLTEPYEMSEWICDKRFSIGSDNSNDLMLTDDSIAPKHAIIEQNGHSFSIKDLGSDTGTTLNGRKVEQATIACHDKLKLGNIDISIVDPEREMASKGARWALIGCSGSIKGQEFLLQGEAGSKLTVGRGRKCDVSLPGTQLERKHISIEIAESQLRMVDLNTVTGTYLNGERVPNSSLVPGDTLRMDILSFKVFGPGYPMAISEEVDTFSMPPIVFQAQSKRSTNALDDSDLGDPLLDSSEIDELMGEFKSSDVSSETDHAASTEASGSKGNDTEAKHTNANKTEDRPDADDTSGIDAGRETLNLTAAVTSTHTPRRSANPSHIPLEPEAEKPGSAGILILVLLAILCAVFGFVYLDELKALLE